MRAVPSESSAPLTVKLMLAAESDRPLPLVTTVAVDAVAATDALLVAVEMPPPLDPGTVIFGVIGAVIVGAVLPKTPEMLLNVPGVDVMPLTVGISAPGLIRFSPLMIAFTASIAKLRIGLMTARPWQIDR